MKKVDFVVIGAGMSGASAAYFLSDHGQTVLLEKEDVPGYHATGRSAAIFSEHHGPDIVCKLAKASYEFLENPPENFSETPLLTPRGFLFTGTIEEKSVAENMCIPYFKGQAAVREISTSCAKELMPFVKNEFLQTPAYYEDAKEIDVAALHNGFLKGAKKKGCLVLTGQIIDKIEKSEGGWLLETKEETFFCHKIINAAGAWADEVATLAGMPQLGITPKRRTVISVDLPSEYHGKIYPMVVFHDQKLYFKNENAQVLISPMDMTPSPPVDTVPEEYDIAVASYLFEERTGIKVEKINNSWAGLRSFFEDGAPIIENYNNSGFIWLAGQGGYGIKIAQSMARIATSVATDTDMPKDILDLGISLYNLASSRLFNKDMTAVKTKLA